MSDSRDISELRRSLKSARNSISADQRSGFEEQATHHLSHWDYLQHCASIACYLSVQGEFPTSRLIQQLRAQNKQIYLPILRADKKNHLAFQQYSTQQALIPNKYGIPEPVPDRNLQINEKELDLVILPLLGFDHRGHRLGMGGGYYDRTFAFAKGKSLPHRPYLLGLAFRHQHCKALNAQPWDVPLDGILTEKGFI